MKNYSSEIEESKGAPLMYASAFAAAASLIFSFPISTCSRKWFLMKNLIPRLVQLQTCSFTKSPVHPYFFLFHLSSSTPHSLIPPLLISSVWLMCTVLWEKQAGHGQRCWIGGGTQWLTYLPPMLCWFWQFSCNIMHAYTYNNGVSAYSHIHIKECMQTHIHKCTVQWIHLLSQTLPTEPYRYCSWPPVLANIPNYCTALP